MLELTVLLSLATWRLTHLLYDEDGPKCVFRKLRTKLGIMHDSDGQPVGYPETFWGGLFACFWCLSIWVAFPLAVMTALVSHVHVWYMFLLWVAVSAGAIVMNEWMFRSMEDG